MAPRYAVNLCPVLENSIILKHLHISKIINSMTQMPKSMAKYPVVKLNSENNGIKIAQNNIIKRVISADTPVFSSSHNANKPIQIPKNKLVKVMTGIVKSKLAPSR